MGKDYFRIDDRLIHGQIVTAWCSFLKINEIVAIDDKLASNPMLQTIMLMGIPKNYKAHVVTSEQAKKLLDTPSDGNRLFVTRFTQDLANYREQLKKCEICIIGNASKKNADDYNLTKGGGSVFFASREDVELLDEVERDGVNLIYQTVPTSPKKTWSEMRESIS